MSDKKINSQIILDIVMVLISVYMTIDYSMLIVSGDDLVRRKIVLVVWALAIVGWSIKLTLDMKRKSRF